MMRMTLTPRLRIIFGAFIFAVLLPLITSAQTVTCPALSKNLSLGSRGPEVVKLQNFLISQNFLALGSNSGYFGKLTQTAVQQWQKKNGVVSSGTPATTGYGSVGAKTRKAMAACAATSNTPPSAGPADQSSVIQSLQNQINQLNQKLANQGSSPPPPPASQTTVIQYVIATTSNTTPPASNTSQTNTSQTSSSNTLSAVTDCGAKGDGSTDNRAALQQCIDDHATSGATITFPSGTYRVNGTLHISHGGIILDGGSNSSTHLEEVDPVATLIDISNGGAVVNLTTIKNINLLFATTRASGTLVSMNTAWRTYVQNVVFGSTAESYRMGAQGISASGGNEIHVESSNFATPMGRAMYFTGTMGDIYLNNSEINMDYPSEVSAAGLVFDNTANGIYATNLNITAGDIGVEFVKSNPSAVAPSYGFFTNVLCDRQKLHGWYLQEAASISLSNSWASSAGLQGIFADKSEGLSVTGSRIYNNGDAGIWIEGSPHVVVLVGRNGAPELHTLRLAGNVLVWEHGARTLRLEGPLRRDEALRIARSIP